MTNKTNFAMFAVAASVLMIGAVSPAFAYPYYEILAVTAVSGSSPAVDNESMSVPGCGTVYSSLKAYESQNKVQLWFNASACPSEYDSVWGEVEVKNHDGTVQKQSWTSTMTTGGFWFYTSVVPGDDISGNLIYYI